MKDQVQQYVVTGLIDIFTKLLGNWDAISHSTLMRKGFVYEVLQ